MSKRKLTKEGRERLRTFSAEHEPTDISDVPLWSWIDELLDDIDAADEEIAKWKRLYGEVVEEAMDGFKRRREENERLRAALKRIADADDGYTDGPDGFFATCDECRAKRYLAHDALDEGTDA